MNKKNIFWFIIDSVRTYRSGEDDRDRIDIMDELANDSIEFTNCFTSAPSSLLAAGAIYTGLPSVFIARHFNDWKFKGDKLTTIKSLVKKHNYISFPLLNAREEREKYQFLLPPFEKKFLPKKYHLSDYAWHNWEITEIFEHIMDNNEFDKPVAFTFWYDCRRDPNISEYVKKAIQKIKEKGMYEDSIIIMHSDHGYPDPRTNLNEGFFRNYGHDMVLTDDNIKTPLIIKYPNCPQNLKIPNVVGHIDILPTIFDILKVPYKRVNTQFQGESLLSIITGDEKDRRIRRTDTRLSMDTGKITSLRSKNYKYLNFYDDGTEFLIDMENDKHEIGNVIDSKNPLLAKDLLNFRQLIKTYEKEIFEFHKETLIENANKSLEKSITKTERILIVSKAPQELLEILYSYISSKSDGVIDLLYSGDKQRKDKIGFNENYFVPVVEEQSLNKLHLSKYNLILYLTENSRRVFLKKSIYKGIKSIESKQYLMINYNFEVFNYFYSRWFGTAIIKLFFDWEVKSFFYKQEPLYFFRGLSFFIKSILKKLILRKNFNEDLNAAKEIMEFRKYHLSGNKSGLDKMGKEQMNLEFDRIKTRDE